MPSLITKMRARLSAETAKRISAAHVSNEDSREHIRASREAIARSFETLAMPYSRTGSSG
jgi:hypothetical protein